MYQKLKVRLLTRFPIDVVRRVLAGELNFALVTAPPEDAQITAVPFARAPLYVALPEAHPAARKEHLALRDLARDEWILLAKPVHPILHDAILETARLEGIGPKNGHEVMTAHQAVHLVSEHAGVAIFAKPTTLRVYDEGVVVKPLSDTPLWFETCLVMRAGDSSRLVNEFARLFLRRFTPRRLPAAQMTLPLPA